MPASYSEKLPRFVLFRGRRVRVVNYEGDGQWKVLDTNAEYRTVHRTELTFIRDAKIRRQGLTWR